MFSGRSHFLRNLLIALSGCSASTLPRVAQVVAFALTWRGQHLPIRRDVVDPRRDLLLPSARGRPLAPAAQGRHRGDVAGMLVIAVQTLQQSEVFYNSGRQATLRRLMPPALRLAPLREESVFSSAISPI